MFRYRLFMLEEEGEEFLYLDFGWVFFSEKEFFFENFLELVLNLVCLIVDFGLFI